MPILRQALTVADLPPPPAGKTGFPWTEASPPPNCLEGDYPLITVVTPSYNQAAFIEETIRSVLLQNYPNLEYIIIDGGSTDGSVDVIQKYAPFLSYWVSEPDRGQAHALNKGFARATGDLIGWQNSDDYYHAHAFHYARQAALQHPTSEIIYGRTDCVDEHSRYIQAYPVSEFSIEASMPYLNACNQAMFFRKRIFEQGEFLDESFQHAMDHEFILRLALKGVQFAYDPRILGYFRYHAATKGFRCVDRAAKEVVQVYKMVYASTDLPASAREKAVQCIHSLCMDNFTKYRLQLFRDSFADLIVLAGFRYISPGLMGRYLLSFCGPHGIRWLRELLSLFSHRPAQL